MALGCIPDCKKGSGAFGARVQAFTGLSPWNAKVPPTERAGSEGSYECCLRQRCREAAPFLYLRREPPLHPLNPPAKGRQNPLNPLNPHAQRACP